MGLGAWAVQKALSVGIFPYVFKLLSSPATVCACQAAKASQLGRNCALC